MHADQISYPRILARTSPATIIAGSSGFSQMTRKSGSETFVSPFSYVADFISTRIKESVNVHTVIIARDLLRGA